MGQHIGIGVPVKTLVMGNIHPAQDELAPLGKGMHVHPQPRAQIANVHFCSPLSMFRVQKHGAHGAGQKHVVLGHGELDVVALALHHEHPAAQALDER